MSAHHATGDRPAAFAGENATGGTILLVEDEACVRKPITRFLILNGYRLLTAETGLRAISLWQRHRHEIDLLLTDVILPDGPDGRQLSGQFQAEKPTLKVIYTSAFAFDDSNELECDPEDIHFVPKPYRPDQILSAVRFALERDSRNVALC